MNPVYSLFSISLLGACAGAVAEPASIHGFVRDSVGQPIRHAVVYAVERDRARADSTGLYVLDSLRPGPVTVRATWIGYRMQEYKIKLQSGERRALDFCLPAVFLDNGPPSSPHCPGWKPDR